MDLTVFLSVALFIVIALLLGLLVYSGLLTDISVEARKSPYDELLVYYRSHIGPYSDVGDLFRATQQLAPNNRLIGIYLDDPKYIPSDCCRSAVGAIVANPTADAATVSRLESAGYVKKMLPKAENVVYCTFPLINKISVYISAWRVYPAMRDYLIEHSLTARPFIEICEDGRLVFLAPLSRYDEFQPDILAPGSQQVQAQAQAQAQEQEQEEVQEQPVQKQEQQQDQQVPAETVAEEPQAESCTEALISEAVAEAAESAVSPPSPVASGSPHSFSGGSGGGEVETVFENRHDLLEAMADRPDLAADLSKANEDSDVGEEAGEGMDLGEVEGETNANSNVGDRAQPAAEVDAEGEGEGDEEDLEALEQRLAQLEEDLSDKQSRVRSDVSQFNNSLALAEIEEHLRRTVPESVGFSY